MMLAWYVSSWLFCAISSCKIDMLLNQKKSLWVIQCQSHPCRRTVVVPIAREIKGFTPFTRVLLKFKLAYYNVTVQDISHCAMGDFSLCIIGEGKKLENISLKMFWACSLKVEIVGWRTYRLLKFNVKINKIEV